MYAYVLCISTILIMSLFLLIVFYFIVKLVDMVLETHPTSPHVDSTAFKSQPVRPSAPGQDSRCPDNIL